MVQSEDDATGTYGKALVGGQGGGWGYTGARVRARLRVARSAGRAAPTPPHPLIRG